MIPNTHSRVEWVTWAWQVLSLAVVYVVTGLFGMQFTHYLEAVTLVWPPTGLSLAALILFGGRLWPGVFIGALLVNLVSPSSTVLASAGAAIGNSLEALVGATLLVRVADFRPNLERQRDIAAFILIGALGCTTISATIGVSSFYLFGHVEAAQFGPAWLNWWLGDAAGAVIVTPIVLTMARGTPSWTSLARRRESWLVLGSLLFTSLFAFFGPDLGQVGLAASVACFPVLVWAGTRLGPRGAIVASFLILLIAAIATAQGRGPFVGGTMTESITLLWSYSLLIGIAALTLAAAVEQRDASDRKTQFEETERLRTEKQKLLLLERERLTREMHDGLGGQLVSVLSMVERGRAAPSEVAEALRRAIDDIRIVIDSLDPSTTDLPTSLGKLRARLEPLLRRNEIDLRWHVGNLSGLDMISQEATIHVLRIIQEAITNTLRHANASSVELTIIGSDDVPPQLRISIHDDGRGLSKSTSSGGRGMKNMRSRTKELGGVLRIESSNSGTQIELMVPFSDLREAPSP